MITHLDSNNIFTLDEKVYQDISESGKEKVIIAADIFEKLVSEYNLEFSFSLLDMKSDFLSSVDQKSIYIFFDTGISDKKYETYYGLINGNSGDGIKTEKNTGSNFFYIYSKTKFTPEVLKRFVCLTIEEITKNKKKLKNQKRRARV